MSNKGFSHIGLSTLDLDKTRAFYEDVLGFKPVVSTRCASPKAATCGMCSSMSGATSCWPSWRRTTCRACRPSTMPASTAAWACPPPSITSPSRRARKRASAAKRDQLRAKGLEVTDIVDHGWAKSIYFSDPNGLSLEYCCLVRDLTEDDARMQERGTIPLARLDFKNRPGVDLSRVPPARGKVMA